jgi:hypothetical protein
MHQTSFLKKPIWFPKSLNLSFYEKKIYVLDTFEEHPELNIREKDIWGINQNKQFKNKKSWCKLDIDFVKKNIKKLCNFKKYKIDKRKIWRSKERNKKN